jgi:hypothetical protein
MALRGRKYIASRSASAIFLKNIGMLGYNIHFEYRVCWGSKGQALPSHSFHRH